MAAHPGARGAYLEIRSRLGVPFQGAAVRRYMRDHAFRRLHLGAGRNHLSGWLNTDYLGHYPDCLRLDARRRFPLPARSFDVVFSEHMIEHLSFKDGMHMLAECFRVLKPGGVARIETPDLRRIVSVCETPLDEERLEYLRFQAKVFNGASAPVSAAVAINNAMRHWGHCFVYDEETLRHGLTAAGFSAIERVATGRSRHAALDGLKSREWLRTNVFETLAMEAARPVVEGVSDVR